MRAARRDGALGERLRLAIAATESRWQTTTLRVTISLGVAELGECAAGAAGKDLVALADRRLYRPKQSGRDRVCSA